MNILDIPRHFTATLVSVIRKAEKTQYAYLVDPCSF
jgi:hypothetical protein